MKIFHESFNNEKELIGPPYKKWGKLYIMAKCQKCLSIREYTIEYLKRRRKSNGGCRSCNLSRKYEHKDISGIKIGKLTAIKFIGFINNKRSQWQCKCDCGQIYYLTSTQFLKEYKKCKCV